MTITSKLRVSDDIVLIEHDTGLLEIHSIDFMGKEQNILLTQDERLALYKYLKNDIEE